MLHLPQVAQHQHRHHAVTACGAGSELIAWETLQTLEGSTLPHFPNTSTVSRLSYFAATGSTMHRRYQRPVWKAIRQCVACGIAHLLWRRDSWRRMAIAALAAAKRTDCEAQPEIVDAHKGRAGPLAAVVAARRAVAVRRTLAQPLDDAAPAVLEGHAQAALRGEQEGQALPRKQRGRLYR